MFKNVTDRRFSITPIQQEPRISFLPHTKSSAYQPNNVVTDLFDIIGPNESPDKDEKSMI